MAIIRKRGEDEALTKETTINIHKTLTDARKHLRILSHGVKEGTQKGKNIIPDHTLALSVSADKSAYHRVEVDYQNSPSPIFAMRLSHSLRRLHVVSSSLLIRAIR